MRGKKAKALRKLAYGPTGSIRLRQYQWVKTERGNYRLEATGSRAIYQKLKKGGL